MFGFFTKLNNITEFLLQGKAFANEASVIISFAIPFYTHQCEWGIYSPAIYVHK